MLIFLVALLNAIAAGGIQLIINNFMRLGLLFSFLLSLVTYIVIGTAYYFKEKCDPETGCVYYIGVSLAVLATLSLLYPVVGSFQELWSISFFWTKAFLVWVGLQALIMIWVALKRTEE